MPKSKGLMLFRRNSHRVKPKDLESGALPENYEMRKGQMEFIQEAKRAIMSKEIFVGSAPCGIGKSLASLLAILPELRENRLMICFRTRSQLNIYLKELRALSRPLHCVSLFSKQDMCPLKKRRSLSYFDFFEECKRLRENCMSSAKPVCQFYMNILRRSHEAEDLAMDSCRRILAPEESVQFMSKRGFCAYESLKRILPKVNVFLGTYHYAFDPAIRASILKSFKTDLSEVFLIVDEAHNVPAFARELLSDKLTEGTVERALKETEIFEHELSGSVRMYLQILMKKVFGHAQSILKADTLKACDPRELGDLFLVDNGAMGNEVASLLLEYGEYVRNKQFESGSEKISSYNHRIGTFLERFFDNVGSKYVHLVEKDRHGRVAMRFRTLDGREIVDPILRSVRGAILMSGFLSPPTIYRDLMVYCSDRVCLKEFGSPFPKENRLILAAEDVSSEFKKRTHLMLEKWKNYIEVISSVTPGNLAVFFTSYGLMNEVSELIKTNRRTIMEEQFTRRNEVIEKLRVSSKNILYGVMGAKLSEGMDYPDNILKCVVTVGLPLATWSIYEESLISYLEQHFPGKGRTYAYLTPAILRLIQACGRVHRSARDRGCIAILDERVTHTHVKQQLPIYYQNEMIPVQDSHDCCERMVTFWNKECPK